MNIFIKIIVFCIFAIELIYFLKNKNKSKLFYNEKFWILAPWTICLFMYCFSGIEYVYNLDFYSFGYILVYWLIFFLGYALFKRKNNDIEINNDFSKKINLRPLFIISIIGILIYSISILSNNNIEIGVTRNINSNAISTIGLMMSCSSLIIWLYEFAYALLNSKKITLIGFISCIIFNIPGIIISGRDSLSIFLISSFIIFYYCGIYKRKNKKDIHKIIRKFRKFFLGISICLIGYLILLTNNRYGSSNDAALSMFKWSSGAKFPDYMVYIYNTFGGLGKIFLNAIFYYTSQFSKFSLMFYEYNGPYLGGFFELHYISRLLPESLGLNYTLVTEKITNITSHCGIPGLKVFWDTSIGYMIFDYGRVGTLFVIFIWGVIVQKISSWSRKSNNIIQIISQSLVCTFLFITIEFSPLFDYFLIFPIIWNIILIILLRKK